MQISEQFTVTRPVADVWALFLDIPEVARCLPGAEMTSDNGDGTYDGRVEVKLGPISAAFDGTATVVTDESSYTSHIKGRGVDRSGGSQGTVDVDVVLTDMDGEHTDVNIAAAVVLAGPIAQFGRTGLVNEVSRRLIDQFADCLHKKLDAGSGPDAAAIEAPEVKGISLGFAALVAALGAWFRRLTGRSSSESDE